MRHSNDADAAAADDDDYDDDDDDAAAAADDDDDETYDIEISISRELAHVQHVGRPEPLRRN